MLHRFMFFTLLLAAGITMSFSTFYDAHTEVNCVEGGNTLTVTNPSAGTAVMTWSFGGVSAPTYYIIIEDVVHHTTVVATQTSLTTYTATGLAAGTYRFRVSNGSSYIGIEDTIMA